MATTNGRQLSPTSQERLRRRVVAAVEAGTTQSEAAAIFGVGIRSVSRWMLAFRCAGDPGLTARKRGRRPGSQQALDVHRQERVRRALLDNYPDELALSGLVWSRALVAELVRRWFGVDLSRVTIGMYLRRWGLAPRPPALSAHAKHPSGMRSWLDDWYSAIVARVRREKGIVLWLTPAHTDAYVADKNTIAAITNRGELYFAAVERGLDAGSLIGFVDRLHRQLGRKIHLIVDWPTDYREQRLEQWLEEHTAQIEIHFLPG